MTCWVQGAAVHAWRCGCMSLQVRTCSLTLARSCSLTRASRASESLRKGPWRGIRNCMVVKPYSNMASLQLLEGR